MRCFGVLLGYLVFLFCGARARWPPFFAGPENVHLATCCIHTVPLPCCRAIRNKNSLNSCAIYARNPLARGPNEHIFGPPSSCKSDFDFHTLFTPPSPPPIASLQQLPALFQRFPSSVPPPLRILEKVDICFPMTMPSWSTFACGTIVQYIVHKGQRHIGQSRPSHHPPPPLFTYR